MIKLVSLLVSAVVLLLAALAEGVTSDGVYVFQEHVNDSVPVAGIIISCSIETGNVEGFARLQGSIPAGFKAEAIVTQNAQFISSGQQYKFIWMELPATPVVSVKYRLVPTGEASSAFSQSASFSYVHEGKTITFHAEPLFVEPSPVLARQLQQQKPAVERRVITLDQEADKYRVEIRIRNGAGQLPSRYVDQLPEKYTASILEDAGASSGSESRKVRFEWNSFPDQQEVTISYLLSRNGAEEAPIIEGIFLFGDELEIAQQGEDYHPVTMETTDDEQFDRSGLMASLSPLLPPPSEEYVESEKATTSIAAAIPAASGAVYYKVQVLATRERPALNSYELKTFQSGSEPVELYEYNGWRKYMTGYYPSYYGAQSAKSNLREKVRDAFIVAFRNGQPIPVAEALSAEKRAD